MFAASLILLIEWVWSKIFILSFSMPDSQRSKRVTSSTRPTSRPDSKASVWPLTLPHIAGKNWLNVGSIHNRSSYLMSVSNTTYWSNQFFWRRDKRKSANRTWQNKTGFFKMFSHSIITLRNFWWETFSINNGKIDSGI